MLSLALLLLVASASAKADQTIPGHYIVVLKDSVKDPAGVAREHVRDDGAQISDVYSRALKGYAAVIPLARLGAVKSDPRVAYVSADTTFHAAGTTTACTTPSTCQVLPSGIDRIDADRSSTRPGDGRGSININVAVLDTGIDLTHPDLNVAGGVNCSNGHSYADANGHGTLVAGIVGARDDSFGVVGVAPGARLWSVRVLDNHASGSTSTILCGIDWATATRTDSDPSNDIAVANMSLAGTGSDDGNCGLTKKDVLHQAICASSAAGVTYVVGAGNAGADFQGTVPASYGEVLTATALADFDGQPGGLSTASDGCGSSPSSVEAAQLDDHAASFSDYATLASDQAHTIAAPGVCILSDYPPGTFPDPFAIGSGTSFASPHVAGTVALCIASGACAGLTPAQIIQKIRSDAAAYNQGHPTYGFTGDPLHSPDPSKYYGYLIRAGLY